MRVNNLSVTISDKKILDNISFELNNNDKVGLVGKNGVGKSTLLRVLCDNNKAVKLGNDTIGYLKQEISHEFDDYSIIDYIKSDIGIDKLSLKLHDLENNLTSSNMDEYEAVLNDFLALDGYRFEDNLKIIANGLNLKEELDTKIGILSGGEKIKVLLASLLLKNSDILLLDEATNNLDMEAIIFLENYLKDVKKKMIIVSHDEYFLQNIVNRILELDDGHIREYNMRYNDYLLVRENEYNREHEEYIRLKEEKEKLKTRLQKAKEWANKGNNKKTHSDNDKIANNFAKERTNNTNISKITKEISKMDIPSFEEKKPIDVWFDLDNKKGNKDIILNNLICGYDKFKTPLINLDIPFGSKVQINGNNGDGKTTLLKTILKEIKPVSGDVIVGSGVRMGYISQDTLNLKNDYSLIEYIVHDKEDIDLSFVFTLLDKFGISYDEKDKKYNMLSPGERTRVNLACIALNKTNVLILDEVVNHLDKEALDLIYELVTSYKGTIISVSHNQKYNEMLKSDIALDIKTGISKQQNLVKNKKY